MLFPESSGDMDPILINAVVFEAEGLWVAQCLEYDFVSCAATEADLPGALMRQVLAQISIDLERGREPFFEFRPAPPRYWALFEEARLRMQPIRKLSEISQHNPVEAHLFPVAA
jgi:hypothetical protein